VNKSGSFKFLYRDKMILGVMAVVIFVAVFINSRAALSADITELRVGIYDFKPLTFVDTDGKAKGFFIDIMDDIARQENRSITYVYGDFNQCLTRLKGGEIDLIAGVAYSDERAKEFDFTKEHLFVIWAEIYTPEKTSIKTILNLKDKRIGVVEGAQVNRELKTLLEGFGIDFRLQEYKNYADVLQSLDTSESDAGVLTNLYGFEILETHPVERTQIFFAPTQLRVAVRKEVGQDMNGRNITYTLDRYFSKYKADTDSIYYSSYKRWIEPSGMPPINVKMIIPAWLYWLFFALTLFSLLSIGFNRLLKRMVKMKTEEVIRTNEILRVKVDSLRESEEELKESQRIAHVGSWRLDLVTNQVVWSDELYKMYGFDPTLPPPPYTEHQKLFTPESWDRLSTAFNNTADTGVPYELELETVREEGIPGWMWVHGKAIQDEKGAIVGLRGAVRDITDRKQVEEVQSFLAQTSSGTTGKLFFDKLARYLAQTLNMDFVCIDRLEGTGLTARTVSVWCDGHFEDNVTYALKDTPCGDVVGKTVCCFPAIVCQFFPNDQVLQDLRAESYVGVTLFDHIRQPIGLIAVIGRKPLSNRLLAENILKLVAVRAAGEMERLDAEIVLREIEKQKVRLEDQLQQAQKMESIGTLAGGIAHDFNNILFPIIGYTEMLMDDLSEESSSIRESLNQIYTGALRARDLVQQILAFARQEKNELKLMKMQPIIKEAMKLIRSTIPTTISITQNLQPDCGPVAADPTQIHQIVMNLATNAYNAMEENGGELKVNLKEIELGEGDLIDPDMSPGLYACLTIADTGMGMNKDVMNRIFDPFFTTKEKGKGTGMGLSVVHGIVKRMKGEIQVYSEPGKGTEFKLYLPIVKSASESQEPKADEPLAGGCEKLLLVDDEESIIVVEKQVLERLGYQVTSLTSSIEALEAFRADPDKFDLVITDMSMPKLSGDKLAHELIKMRPDIPVLLCTGFSEAMTDEKIKSMGLKGLLMKPIMMKDLAQKIREVLDK